MVVFGRSCSDRWRLQKARRFGPPAQATPAPTAQPTVTMTASPSTVNPGASVNLTWSSTNATDLSIDPSVGKVAVEGSTPVTPTESTTYMITANGPGGTATAQLA